MMDDGLEIFEEDNVSISYDQGLTGWGNWSTEKLVNIVKSVADGEGFQRGAISIIIGDDEMLKSLNNKWLKIDAPTNVLAFDLSDGRHENVEGDIYISMDRVLAQADEHGLTPETELLRLIAHGMLHLCGMDHNDDISLRKMFDRGEIYVRMVQ